MILVAAQYGQLWQVRRTCNTLESCSYQGKTKILSIDQAAINPLRIRKPTIITDLSVLSQYSQALSQLSSCKAFYKQAVNRLN
jgi:hypothetical protein